jgi:hypothetical protein
MTGSSEVLAKMSKKMSVHAIGEYISEASSAPEGGEAISKTPLPLRALSPHASGVERGAAAKGQHREWNVKPLPCHPTSEETTPPEALFRDVTAPEKGGEIPRADREEMPGQLPSEIVSQDSAQMTQSLRNIRQGKLVWRCNRDRVTKSEKMVSKWCALPVTVMTAMMMSLCLVAPAAAFLAYDCSNNTNVVEAYNLLEPAPSHCYVGGTRV